MSGEAVVVVRGDGEFNAPAEVVFGVLTDPDRMTRWLPLGVSAEAVGDGLVRVLANGRDYEFDVSFVVDELRMEWRGRDSGGPRGVAWVQDAPAGGCVVHGEVAVSEGAASRARVEELLGEALLHLQRDVSDNFNAG
jgi:hypothetical protein